MRWRCSRSKRRTTNVYASQDLVDGRRSRRAGARRLDELFHFQRMQNRVKGSERDVRSFGEDGGLRFHLPVRIHLCAERPEHRALARAQFRCRRSWFDTPLCRGVGRLTCGLGRAAVFSVGVVSGAFGFEEDRDDFQNARRARIAVNHGRQAVLKGDYAEWPCAGTHGHVLCAHKRRIGRYVPKIGLIVL